jgi:hypothetical protein
MQENTSFFIAIRRAKMLPRTSLRQLTDSGDAQLPNQTFFDANLGRHSSRA